MSKYIESIKILRELEIKVKVAGFPWGYDESPPTWWNAKKEYSQLERQGQQSLFSPLCTSCEFHHSNLITLDNN